MFFRYKLFNTYISPMSQYPVAHSPECKADHHKLRRVAGPLEPNGYGERERETETDGRTDGRTDRQTGKQTVSGRQPSRQTDRCTDRESETESGRPTDRQIDRQKAGRQAEDNRCNAKRKRVRTNKKLCACMSPLHGIIL